MTEGYNTIYKTGDRIILELRNKQIFEGVYGDGGKDRVVLIKVIQHNGFKESTNYGGILEFYRNEIEKIHKLTCNEVKHKTPAKETSKAIKISEAEYLRLKQLIRSSVYVCNTGRVFKDAIKHIGHCQTISIAFAGADKQRTPEFVQLLIISTWDRIYTFDFIKLPSEKHFYAWLKPLLEDHKVRKIIHKSAGLADVLDKFYSINLTNVYDLHIVDLLLQKQAKEPLDERNISECLVHYLNLPESIVERALCMPHPSWSDRPVVDKVKTAAAQLGAYLITLKKHFDELMFQDIYESIPRIIDVVYDMDDFRFMDYNRKTVPDVVQQLIPDLNKLNL